MAVGSPQRHRSLHIGTDEPAMRRIEPRPGRIPAGNYHEHAVGDPTPLTQRQLRYALALQDPAGQNRAECSVGRADGVGPIGRHLCPYRMAEDLGGDPLTLQEKQRLARTIAVASSQPPHLLGTNDRIVEIRSRCEPQSRLEQRHPRSLSLDICRTTLSGRTAAPATSSQPPP